MRSEEKLKDGELFLSGRGPSWALDPKNVIGLLIGSNYSKRDFEEVSSHIWGLGLINVRDFIALISQNYP